MSSPRKHRPSSPRKKGPTENCAECNKKNKLGFKFCVGCGKPNSKASPVSTIPSFLSDEGNDNPESLSKSPKISLDIITAQKVAQDQNEEELSQPLLVQIYDVLKIHGVERTGQCWYCTVPLIDTLGISIDVVSSWNDPTLAYLATNVIPPGGAEVEPLWMVSRVGLLKLIARGESQIARDILEAIAGGLEQFDNAEKAVKRAEDSRINFARKEKEQKETAVQKEFDEWEAEMERKRLERKKRREERKRMEQSAMEEYEASKRERKGTLIEKYQTEKEKADKARNRRSTMALQLRTTRQRSETRKIEEEERIMGIERPKRVEALDEEPEAGLGVTGDSLLENDATRVMPMVAVPTAHKLTVEELFRGGDGAPRLSLLQAHFKREGRLTESCCRELLVRARKIMEKEENVLELRAPIHVFGDIHGQFFDLCTLISKAGSPAQHQQLWLGDYVDRGAFGCEVALMLLAAKIKYPDKVFLLRGNHESRQMAEFFNFCSEATNKYSQAIYGEFMKTFDALPLTAVVETLTMGRFYCAHGGLSPMIRTYTDVNRLERFEEPPGWGPVCDILWSDPADIRDAGADLLDKATERWLDIDFEDNTGRGCGQVYGRDACERFLEDNEMVCLIRAHEVQKNGYQEHRFFKDDRPLPMVITLFSAPNYCGTYENRAAWLTLEDKVYNFGQIAWVDAPYAFPDGTNVFDMSLPIIAESITGFFLAILAELTADDDEEDEEEAASAADMEARERLRNKVKMMGRTMAALRTERKEILSAVGGAGSAVADVKSSEEAFEQSKQYDKINELNPSNRARSESLGNLLRVTPQSQSPRGSPSPRRK